MEEPIINELSQTHLMMKIGDMIPDRPQTIGELRSMANRVPKMGKVIYIHPEGRFYSVWFDCGKNGAGFSECRYFTPNEIEEGRRQGIFRMPSTAVTSSFTGNTRSTPAGFRQMREDTSMRFAPSLDDIDAAM